MERVQGPDGARERLEGPGEDGLGHLE